MPSSTPLQVSWCMTKWESITPVNWERFRKKSLRSDVGVRGMGKKDSTWLLQQNSASSDGQSNNCPFRSYQETWFRWGWCNGWSEAECCAGSSSSYSVVPISFPSPTHPIYCQSKPEEKMFFFRHPKVSGIGEVTGGNRKWGRTGMTGKIEKKWKGENTTISWHFIKVGTWIGVE